MKQVQETFEDLTTLSITALKKLGFLPEWKGHKYGTASGPVNWYRNGERSSWINCHVSILADGESFAALSYNYGSKGFDLRFELVQVKSNLGKGFFWMFVCPESGRRCRKLYSSEGQFKSRPALIQAGLLTKSQSEAKRFRGGMWRLLTLDTQLEESAKKYFGRNAKRQYRGQPTKGYSRWLAKGDALDNFTNMRAIEVESLPSSTETSSTEIAGGSLS